MRVSSRVGGARRCAFCHDGMEHAEQVCPRCASVVHGDCAGLAGRCPTLGCAWRFPLTIRVKLGPVHVSGVRQFFDALFAIVVPLLCFGMSELGFTEPLVETLCAGHGFFNWWGTMFSPAVHRPLYPLLAWSMLAGAAHMNGSRAGWIRVGLVGGVVLGGAFSLVFLPFAPVSAVLILALGFGLLGFAPFAAFKTYVQVLARDERNGEHAVS
ncbi:hypothetical protein OAX78_04725, partial [Planctomycetota bacterium]|nr:hypothetical protein [Planctomycetota bacterium]